MADFYPPDPFSTGSSDGIDIITTTSTAPRTRSAGELSVRVKQAGGALTVNASDSDYIVAVNNGLRFSVTLLANGQYRITESNNWLFLIGVVGLVGVILLSRK